MGRKFYPTGRVEIKTKSGNELSPPIFATILADGFTGERIQRLLALLPLSLVHNAQCRPMTDPLRRR